MTAADIPNGKRRPQAQATPDTNTSVGEIPADGSLHLRQDELAARWRISRRTLQRWRRKGLGPAHLLIGQRVLYRHADVVAYETLHLQPGEAV